MIWVASPKIKTQLMEIGVEKEKSSAEILQRIVTLQITLERRPRDIVHDNQ